VRGDGLFGDFHFNPKHALAEQLAWDATHAPENVGFSHNVEARTTRQANQTVVEAILKVQSVDLVADPATTRGLYENAAATALSPDQSAGPLVEQLSRVTVAQLRALRPDLVDAIEAQVGAGVAALRMEVDALRACEARYERRAMAARLLKEFKLPDPDALDATTRPIVSKLFLETLLNAPDEPAMRALVQERAEVIAVAQKLDRTSAGQARPRSREQNYHEDALAGVFDARAFARAIL
jgi:hypothetical protein